jgi:hypothetical protein
MSWFIIYTWETSSNHTAEDCLSYSSLSICSVIFLVFVSSLEGVTDPANRLGIKEVADTSMLSIMCDYEALSYGCFPISFLIAHSLTSLISGLSASL